LKNQHIRNISQKVSENTVKISPKQPHHSNTAKKKRISPSKKTHFYKQKTHQKKAKTKPFPAKPL
jgi:hypothetical protein